MTPEKQRRLSTLSLVQPLVLAMLLLLGSIFTVAYGQSFPPVEDSSALAQEGEDTTWLDSLLAQMTLEEKICQLFFITPEPIAHVSSVTRMDVKLRKGLQDFPVGGIVLFSNNISGGKQLTALLQDMQAVAAEKHGIGLLLGVDEEGGGVARVANSLRLKNKPPAPSVLGQSGNPQLAYAAGATTGAYLLSYGFTINFAPVADIRTHLDQTEIDARAFSDDPQMVCQMVTEYVKGLQSTSVLATLKHFPGHGSAVGNAHDGRSISTRTVQQWANGEWLPFQAGLEAGAEVVMMSHLTAAVVDNQHPASLSHSIVTGLLRETLGFNGVVITDALRMNAITAYYTSEEACVKALQAGVDMLLIPKNFTNALQGVQAALQDGRLTEARIEESVRRILQLKERHGMIAR